MSIINDFESINKRMDEIKGSPEPGMQPVEVNWDAVPTQAPPDQSYAVSSSNLATPLSLCQVRDLLLPELIRELKQANMNYYGTTTNILDGDIQVMHGMNSLVVDVWNNKTSKPAHFAIDRVEIDSGRYYTSFTQSVRMALQIIR